MRAEIASIIGWTSACGTDNDCCWVDSAGNWIGGDSYNADDLLAWLRTQDVSVWAQEDTDVPWLVSGDTVYLYVVTPRGATQIHRSTLLEALERAVLAVNKETTGE